MVFGDEIDWDHDFVQFSGEPIGNVLKSRNLLQTGEDWLGAISDFRIEENIKEKQVLRPEGIWNTVVTI